MAYGVGLPRRVLAGAKGTGSRAARRALAPGRDRDRTKHRRIEAIFHIAFHLTARAFA
jgi:hypothetical protein